MAAENIHKAVESGNLIHCPTHIRVNNINIFTEEITVSEVLRNAEFFWKLLNEDQKESWLNVLGAPLEDRLDDLHSRYTRQWGDEDKDHDPLAVELSFKVKLPGTDTVLKGQIDYLYRDNSKGGILVARDIKTSKTLSSSESMSDVLDSQLHLYAFGLKPFLKRNDLPDITAVEYDRVRSAMPKQPVITTTGSLSKSVTGYDLWTYLDWSADLIEWGTPETFTAAGKPKFGVYERDAKVVDKLSSPEELGQWFRRTLIPINRNVIRQHVKSAVLTAQDIERTLETEPEALARNFTKDCQWCDYAKLCRAEVMSGIGQFESLEDLDLLRS